MSVVVAEHGSTGARSRSRMQILIGLALTLGVGSLPFPRWDNELADVPHMLGNEAIYWSLCVLVLGYVCFVEKRPLASIGWRRFGWRDALIALFAAVVILAGVAALYMGLFPALHLDEGAQTNRLLAAPGWWLFVSAIRAGVSEEILFRGYPIERLEEWSGRRSVAALLPLIVFSIAHAGSWGWLHVGVAFFGGAALTALYLWRRNLGVNIVAHCLVDIAATLS